MTSSIQQHPVEIMAPVGSYEALRAAVATGAQSIYFGIEQLNMRARAANNFTIQDLREIAKICQENKVKTYLTLNTIMYDHDLGLLRTICTAAKESGITAVICSDIAAIHFARSLGLEVHLSTQTNVTNIEAVKFYAQYADVIVLARELTLQQIALICSEIKNQDIRGPKGELVKIEIFAHGALCVAVSGKCYMSLATYNSSANRGACLQNCRRSYKIIDEETGDELVVDNKYIMSPKDLCTIGFIDKILDAGVSVLKIEGRGRAPEYVHTTTKVYVEAVKCYFAGTYTAEKIEGWISELEKVFNRGFWHGGYYLGKQLGEWSGVYGSKATTEKVYLGKVRNYYQKKKIGEFILEAGTVSVGDEIYVMGPTTGVVQTTVQNVMLNDKNVPLAAKGAIITLPIEERVRENDSLYKIVAVSRKEEAKTA
ncbi:U32 family peptidase [Candidatus Woesearchaeota archaeon]|nr:U32 family peptidase [Candidatus Woesearchaeota archaeon]